MRINLDSKKLLLAAILLSVVTGMGVSAFTDSQTTGASEEPLIVKEVRHHGEKLNNHEARITNTESDVNALQNKTETPPSNTRVEVPVLGPAPTQPETNSGSPAQTTPTYTPIVVSSYEQLPAGGENIDCKFHYSDGTDYQWHWQVVDPQGSWLTDGQGNNGHWVSTLRTIGTCDSGVIGTVK